MIDLPKTATEASPQQQVVTVIRTTASPNETGVETWAGDRQDHQRRRAAITAPRPM